MKTTEYVLWTVLAITLLWPNGAMLLGSFKSTMCRLGVINLCAAIGQDLCVFGDCPVSQAPLWVLRLSRLMLSAASFVNSVWTTGNNILLQIISSAQEFSPMGKTALIVTCYLVSYRLSILMKVAWILLFPVRFLLWQGVLIVTWPYRFTLRIVLSLITKVINLLEALMSVWRSMKDVFNGIKSEEVTLPTGEIVKVSLFDKLDEILRLIKSQRHYESAQQGSDFIAVKTWPSGLVTVRNHLAQTVGMGFLIRAGGKLCLGTAAHVALKCKNGFILSGSPENLTHVKIDCSNIVLQTTMDFILLQVPENTASKLGVSKVKLAKTPKESAAISVFGYVNGRLCQSFGVMGNTTQNMGFKHGLSTLSGFSGSPIFKDGFVVGIHSRCDPMGYNYGLSLDFCLNALKTSEFESSSYDADRYAYHREEDIDYDAEEDFDVLAWEWEGKSARRARANEEGWAEFEQSEGVKAFRTVRELGSFDWSDETPMDFSDPIFEQNAVNFRFRPSNGAVRSTNGKQAPILETCAQLDTSTSTPQVPKVTNEVLPRKKGKKSKNSVIGNGPKVVRKQPGTVCSCTATGSKSANGNQDKTDNYGSETKSCDSTHAATRQNGSQLGKEIRQLKIAIAVVAKREDHLAMESLKRDLEDLKKVAALQRKTSKESGLSSKKT